MDTSGFEPASKLDLQAAVIDRLCSDIGVSDDLMQQRGHSGSLAESREQTDTASPASSPKSFKQAVEGLPSRSQHNEKTNFEHRLATVELAFKEHEHRLKIIDQNAEAVARDNNKQKLVLYGVSDEAVDESHVGTADIAFDHQAHCS